MKSLLIMDDDLPFSLALAENMRDLGYEVDTVSNASDAVEYVKAKQYSAILTDMVILMDNRPVPDGGLTLIHRLRSLRSGDQENAKIPIIGMSGVTNHPGMGSILQTAEALGADATMVKPISPTALAATIESMVN